MAQLHRVQRSLLRQCFGFQRFLSSDTATEVDLNFRLLQDELKGDHSFQYVP